MGKGFLNILFSHTDFFAKILIFLVIYTDFVLDQSGRSAIRQLRRVMIERKQLKLPRIRVKIVSTTLSQTLWWFT